jgi:predicted MPP superfamily phosphohydrolase
VLKGESAPLATWMKIQRTKDVPSAGTVRTQAARSSNLLHHVQPERVSNPLTILHLSDLQFGKNHRYPDLRPTVMVITGDVAEWSLPAEYAAAREFLEKLTAKLAIP